MVPDSLGHQEIFPMDSNPRSTSRPCWHICLVGLLVTAVTIAGLWLFRSHVAPHTSPVPPRLLYEPRKSFDIGGYLEVQSHVGPWDPASLEDCSRAWQQVGYLLISQID